MKRSLRYGAIGIGLFLYAIFAINFIVFITTRSHIYTSSEDAPEAEVAIIPGAAIFSNGALSPIFLDRVDAALSLYEAKKVKKILVSGDNSTVTYNEVNPVRLYLLDHGVLDQDIFLDHAGFDTYSSMYRARDIFGVTSMLITTQSFHLPRAVYIARSLGVEASGVRADVGTVLLRNYLREILANEKAVLNLLFLRKPKYLGEQIPISSDGRNYP